MLEKLHIVITLAAAAVMAVVCLVTGADLYDFAFKMIITIVVFFIIGIFVRKYFVKLETSLNAAGEQAEPEAAQTLDVNDEDDDI